MSVPNVGVTQVIQDPGLGGVLAKGIGGITQLLQQQQMQADQRAKDAIAAQYTNAMTDKLRSDMSIQASDRQMALDKAKQDRDRAVQARDLLISSLGTQLNAGQVASLKTQEPAEAAAWLQKSFFPEVQKFGETDRGIQLNPLTGQATTVVSAAKKPLSNPTTWQEFAATKGLPIDTPPEAVPQFGPEYDVWLNRQKAAAATRLSVNNYGNTADSKSAEEVVKLFAADAADARILRDDNVAINNALTTLNQGIMAGPVGGRLVSAGVLLKQIGLTNSDDASNTRIYLAQIAERVLPIVRKLAPVTEEDRKWLEAAKGGNIDKLDSRGIRRLLELQRDANNLAIGNANRRITESKTLNQTAKADLITEISEALPAVQRFDVPGVGVVTGTLDTATGRYYYINPSGQRSWLNAGGK